VTCAEYRALAAQIAQDPQPFLEKACAITTKGLPGQLPVMRLVLNKPQQRVYDAIQAARAAGVPPRIIILKARQPGISTLCQGLLLARAMSMPHTRSMVIAHVDEAAERLFGKITFMRERLPDELRPRVAPPRKDEVTLEEMPCADGEVELGSTVHVATASGQEVWRSVTLHTVHLSELAQYPYPERVLLGVMPSVPKTPESLVIIESTAQGMGDTFHKEWTRAEAGESDFTPIFIPWYELEETLTLIAAPADFEPDQKERELKRAFGLTHNQLQWRRFIIRTECGGDAELFEQEYPTTAAGAFLLSGRAAFDRKVLEDMYQAAKEAPGERGEWTDRGFVAMKGGRLGIWKRPIEGHEYTIGADVATGIEGGDLSAATVIDRETCEQVAEWSGYIAPIEFAQMLMGLGMYYNGALLAPEINTHGYAVIEEIKRGFYQHVYVFTRPDKWKNSVTSWLGWETTLRTRGLLIDSMDWAIRNGGIVLRSLECIREAQAFRYVTRRRAEGIEFDDRIFAAMIAYRVHLETPLESSGLPPLYRPPAEPGRIAPKEETTPGDPFSRRVWNDVDDEIATMGEHRPTGAEEYAVMDPLYEHEPTDADWLPLGPW
jgi:hypothetical protein